MNNPTRVTHVITGLNLGGAETALYRIVSETQSRGIENIVISLGPRGYFSPKLEMIGVKCYSLNMTSSFPNPLKLLSLSKILRMFNPDVIQTWMYHADFMGGLAAKLAGNKPIVWGVRNSNLSAEESNPRTILIVRVNAALARFLATVIVANSEAAKAIHGEIGYPESLFRVIPNGFDTDFFLPNRRSYLSLRRNLGLPKASLLIGQIGRYDPQKDHKSFIDAAYLLHKERPDIHYLMAGPGVDWENSELVHLISDRELDGSFHLLGGRDDVPYLMAGLDIFTSTAAYGESFPNVVGEAMSCGVPCVVTNVGDSSSIVGKTGVVVPIRNAQAIYHAWRELLGRGREHMLQMGKSARARIQNYYSIERMVSGYMDLYATLIEGNR